MKEELWNNTLNCLFYGSFYFGKKGREMEYFILGLLNTGLLLVYTKN